jgi:hypothetical protein
MRKLLTVAVLCLGIAGLGATAATATPDVGSTTEDTFTPPYVNP